MDDDVNSPVPKMSPPVAVILYAHIDPWNRTEYLRVVPPCPNHEGAYFPRNSGGLQAILDVSFSPPPRDCDDAYIQGYTWPPLVAGPNATAYVYLSGDQDDAGPGSGGAVPDVVLQSQIVRPEGDAFVIVAQGTSEAATVLTGTDGRPVYEFRIPMNLAEVNWTHWEHGYMGYTWRVDFDRLGGSGGAPAGLRVHVGPNFMPRLVLDVQNPLTLFRFEAENRVKSIALRLHALSPFGPQDVTIMEDFLEIRRNGEPVRIAADSFGVANPLGHDMLPEPVRAYWSFDLSHVELSAGDYTVSGRVENGQRTFALLAETEFTIGSPAAKNAPGFEAAPIALVLAALVRRKLA